MKPTSTPGQLALFDGQARSSGAVARPPASVGAAVDSVLRDLAEGVEPSRLALLSHGELSCVLLRFGGRPLSLAETGRAMNLSRFEARRIERAAIRKLAGAQRLQAA